MTTCFRWCFINETRDRYFYTESEKECADRIRKTYRCDDKDYLIISMQERDDRTNGLLKEVMLHPGEN